MRKWSHKLLPLFLFAAAFVASASAGLISIGGARLTVTPPPTTYTTNFPTAENPISQGGKWLGGLTNGTIFQNGASLVNLGTASTYIGATYDDSWALIKSTACNPGPNQYAEGVAYFAPGYTPDTSDELELLLRGSFNPAGPNYAPLYELDIEFGTTNPGIFYQDGTMGGYHAISATGPTFGRSLITGDVVRFAIVGTTLKVYLNGTEVLSATDSSLSTGQPGWGRFVRPSAVNDLTKTGWSSWTCGVAT